MNDYKEILVTGGCGQLGTIVVQQLLENGYRPVVLDVNSSSPYINSLEKEGEIEYCRCDLLSGLAIEGIKKKIRSIRCAVHLASLVGGSVDILTSAIGSVELNVLATINLLSAMPSLQYFVYASSMMVYGRPEYNPIDEEHPTQPMNVYGASKLAAEKFIQVYSLQKGVAVAILRFSSLYGPGEYSAGNRNRVIPMFVRKIRNNEPLIVFPGDEEEIRDYMHLSDAANAVVLSVMKREAGIFNIGSGKGVSIKKLMENMIRLSKKKIRTVRSEERPFKPANYTLDVTRAKKALGFEAKISLKSGLKEELNFGD